MSTNDLSVSELFMIHSNAVYWPSTRPTCHSKVMHRKQVTHSDGSYEKKSRRQAWLKKWDKVKSHGTLIDWCTGREWPVNCMSVISAWWRSNMPFQRLSGRLNYHINRWDTNSLNWRSEEFETRCGRESHQPEEGALRTPDWVGEQRSWRQGVVEKATTRQKGPSGTPVEQP